MSEPVQQQSASAAPVPTDEPQLEETSETKPDAEMQVESVDPNLPMAEQLKQQGNTHFKNSDYHAAIDTYFEALRHCPTSEKKLLSIIYSNLSICYSKTKDYVMVIKYTGKSLQHDPTYRKAWLNQGQAQEAEDKPDEAMESYKKAQELKHDSELAAKMVFLQKKVDQLNEKRKDEVLSGLKNIGNSILGYFGMSLDNFQMNQNDNGSYNVQFKQ